MTYSANCFAGPDYAVGYATAESPLGPFVKAAENPILERGGEVTGTGHSCLFRTRQGQLLICYHGRTAATGQDRVAFLSPRALHGAGPVGGGAVNRGAGPRGRKTGRYGIGPYRGL